MNKRLKQIWNEEVAFRRDYALLDQFCGRVALTATENGNNYM
jgi:hypothetical protein